VKGAGWEKKMRFSSWIWTAWLDVAISNRPGESSFSSLFLTSSPSWQQSKDWNSNR
jgi:hypothetical protein